MSSSPLMKSTAPIWTRDFTILCFATLGVFSGMALIMPVLPLFVEYVNGTRADIGLVVASFAFTSLVLRPLLGRTVDQRGGKIVLLVGVVMLLAASALYLVVPDVPLLLALRVFHGIGMGAATTAIWALVADLAPPDRRGEAMGWFGMFQSGSFAIGPLIGSAVMAFGSFTALFGTLAAVTAAALLLSTMLRQAPRPAHHAALPKPPLISRGALLPALIFLTNSMTFSAITSFLPLLVKARDLGDPSLASIFFSIQAVTIFFGRMMGGSLSDRYGRVIVAVPFNLVLVLGMVLLAFAASPWMFILAGIVHGFGAGAVQPAMMAMAVDRVPERERGAAMATTTSAMDLGFGVAAVPLGLLLDATNSYTLLYLTPGVIVAFGLVAFVLLVRREAGQQRTGAFDAEREQVAVG